MHLKVLVFTNSISDSPILTRNSSSHPKLVSKPTLFILPGQNPPTPHTSTHTHTENRPPTLMKSTAQSLSSEARSLQITECRVTASPHYHHTHPAPPCRTRFPGARRTMHKRELLQPWRLSPSASPQSLFNRHC